MDVLKGLRGIYNDRDIMYETKIFDKNSQKCVEGVYSANK